MGGITIYIETPKQSTNNFEASKVAEYKVKTPKSQVLLYAKKTVRK